MKTKNTAKILMLLWAMVILITNSSLVIKSVRESLAVCFSTVVPSLFPFMVLSSLFVTYTGNSTFKFMGIIFKKIFGISSPGVGAFICGIIAGYPIGAKSVCELYNGGKLTKSEAESLMAYCNNAGPLFVIGAVGTAMFNSFKVGIVLYTVHIICAFLSGIILKPYTSIKLNKAKKNPTNTSLTLSICQSVPSVCNVCGFIIFFGVISALTESVISAFPEGVKCIIHSSLELTNAIKYITKSSLPTALKISFAAAAVGWSGLSVHMQVKSFVSRTDLSLKKYYTAKAFSSIMSALIVYIGYTNMDNIALLINTKSVLITIAVSFGTIILFRFLSKRKRKRRGKNPLLFE